MSLISNIQSVAKYESKLLVRSWFFRVFTVIAVLILASLNFTMLVSKDSYGFWIARTIPSNIPYFILLLLNTGQAVIAIFLASDFLKRDKKLDTSEVFYVRPLSNAEYVIGKIWGNLRVFLILNLLIMAITLVFNLTAGEVDWMAYLLYFLLICVPTLVFIIGLSIFMMLVVKNQALTFVLLLGYIGLTIFYISDKYYYLFDYMAYNLPLMKSTIVGFSNWEMIINHRGIYLFAGLACIFFTIYLFRRLPNSRRSNYPWLFLSLCSILLSITCGYRHVNSILHESDIRAMYTQINNKYVSSPKMVIEQYHISVTQHPDHFSAEVTMKGVALDSSSVFTFCLNPGLTVQAARSGDRSLGMKRDSQILLVDFGKNIAKGDSISLTLTYEGEIDNSFCYLDIPPEVLQKSNTKMLFNIDKQYSFQTKDYLLFTPETCWYPRSGTSYSDKNPDWQQTYFSKYDLKVKPLPGLIPLSQGKVESDSTGVYSFVGEFPSQTITLIIGDYQQKSIVSDSTTFSIWHLKGHDYFAAALDSIQDTIPGLIRDIRGEMQRTYKLEYPFKRLSLVEVPIQFTGYSRTWSQAQETVQPEMVLFAEKGAISDDLNMERRVKDFIRWSKYDGPEISIKEGQMRAFNNFLWLFLRTESNYNFSSSGRGKEDLKAEVNPYFIFPQLYNFRYNIFSSEWSVANRVVELYLQQKVSDGGWEREYNGISNDEKVNLLLEKQVFKQLLADVKLREIQDNIIALEAERIFTRAEMKIGIAAFRDSLYAILKRNTFRNIKFENMLDTLGKRSQTDLLPFLTEWKKPTPLPFYSIGTPDVTKVIQPGGKEIFVVKITLSNNSDYNGVVSINIRKNGWWSDQLPDPRRKKKVEIPAHRNKQLVSIWDEAPIDVEVNTMISGNLPNVINLSVTNIKEERKELGMEPDKEYLLPETSLDTPGELIVDNEDSTLFVLSTPPVVGLLQKWLDKVEVTSFKYSGVPFWRPPFQWVATTNARYYGKYIRSAYVIKSGDGSQTATWKVPIKEAGQYEVYYHVFKNDELRWNENLQGEYHFKVMYEKESEDAYIDLRKSNDGWEQLGTYFFSPGTARIVLTNECKLRSVTADAVKVVKR